MTWAAAFVYRRFGIDIPAKAREARSLHVHFDLGLSLRRPTSEELFRRQSNP
jgi:hypothetical protein